MKLKSIFFGVALAALCVGCSTEKGEDNPIQEETVKLLSSSVSEGAEVDADQTTTITLSYNSPVAVSSKAKDLITLNGVTTRAEGGKNNQEITLYVSLEPEKSYTLNVAEGSIISTKYTKVSAAAFTLHFTTKKSNRPADNNFPDYNSKEMMSHLGFGWNLGNHFDSFGANGNPFEKVPESWGKYWDTRNVTESLYKSLAELGVKTVRMPVTWGIYQDTTTVDYAIDKAYLEEVAQNVYWAEKAGLNVILNTHHDEYWLNIIGASKSSETNDKIKTRITATWKQIAERFKDKGNFLIFETFNEIQDGGWGWGASKSDGGKQYRILNEWNQLAVDVIRATGGNNALRWIGVPGYAANPGFTLPNLVVPTDPAKHIMVAVHCYDPFDFCTTRKYSEWGHTGDPSKKVSGSDEDYINDLFSQLKNKYIDKNIPCYLGEFGATTQPTSRGELFRAYYLEYFCRSAYFHNLPVMLWDNNSDDQKNEPFYFINHEDGSLYNRALMETMIKAATSEDASYTLESIYNKAPK